MSKKFVMPDHISRKARYIICPDMKCKGFESDYLQCTNSETTLKLFPNKGYKLCPHLDKAKMVVFCYHGHPIEEEVNCSTWTRSVCEHDNCHSISFSKMSSTTYRIPLDKYEEFVKLPLKD